MNDDIAASELIADLQKMIEKYGDCFVCTNQPDSYYDILRVTYHAEKPFEQEPIFVLE